VVGNVAPQLKSSFQYAWSIIVFMSMNFCFESYGSEHSCQIKKKYIANYAR
jgi:hypothetical protein